MVCMVYMSIYEFGFFLYKHEHIAAVIVRVQYSCVTFSLPIVINIKIKIKTKAQDRPNFPSHLTPCLPLSAPLMEPPRSSAPRLTKVRRVVRPVSKRC